MYKIAIRADGGPAIGMGHIMRCVAVAEELRGLGCRVYFISRYMQGRDKIVAMGFEAFGLVVEAAEVTQGISDTGFNYGTSEELEDDLIGTRAVAEQQGCDLLLVDKYNLTPAYFDKLREFIEKVAFLDDLNIFKCTADIIINGNINAPLLGYKECFEGQKLLLGTDFTPLRKEFRSIIKRNLRILNDEMISKSIENSCQYPEIMITTGGADPYNCTGRLLEILLVDKKTGNMRYNVIVNSGFAYKYQIQRMADENSNIVLHIDPNCMSEIMCRSDLAISSGGSTLYELCCCGTPTLAFVMADNQKGIVDTLSNGGYIQSLGWYNEIENANIVKIVSDLIINFELRKNYSQKMQSLIDGKGANRIAKEIINTIEN